MNKTKIEWADYVTNPIRAERLQTLPMTGGQAQKRGYACVKISEGCRHCWASTFNVRLGTGLAYTMPALKDVQESVNAGELRRIATFSPPKGPYKNGRLRPVVFACDMTDLFGEWRDEAMIDDVFLAMAGRADLDFIVLTKRVERMLQYASGKPVMRHVVLGASVENERESRNRAGAMRQIHDLGWKTIVSYEPALEQVDWRRWDFMDGLICGGESGSQARPMPIGAARDARDYCYDQGIPFFFKQWGEWAPFDQLGLPEGTTFRRAPVMVDGVLMFRVGKGLAGHTLDGRMWQEMVR